MDFIRSHKLIVATIVIQIIALPLILLLVKERQQTQTEATAGTTLSFDPTSSSESPIVKNVGEVIPVSLSVSPVDDLISSVKIQVDYDPTKVKLSPNNPVTVNTQSFPITSQGPIISESGMTGTVAIEVSVGADQTKVIQSKTQVLTLNFTAVAATNETQLTINTGINPNTGFPNTDIRSIAIDDRYDENVLIKSSLMPAYIRIEAPVTPSPSPVACVPAYDENGGSVVIEAEHFDLRTSNGDSHSWNKINGGPYPEQPGDILFMRASPNDGATIFQGNIQNSPEISYDIDFETTGTYWVYVRGSGNNGSSHVVHMGLDGSYVSTMDNYFVGQDGYSSTWLWKSINNDGTRAKVNITTPGVHTLHFWMRDSGAKIDRVRLLQNNSWTPSVNLSDKGPNESSRIVCPDETPTPEITPVCTQSQPQVIVTGGTNKSVLPGQSTQYTINVTNQNSSGCETTTFNIENLLSPFTPNITWNFSETTFTLAPGATKTITLTMNANNSTAPGAYTNTVSATETDSGLISSTVLQLNVVAPTPTPQPTATPAPTAGPTSTPIPTLANTVLNFNGLKLHGLGAGGDNPNPTSWGTLNPLRPTRDLVVQIYNTSGNLVHTGNTTITYTGSNTGLFNGSLTLPSSIASGTYTIKITSPYYLTKLIPGFLNLIQGTTHNVTSVALVAGDVNRDNQLRVSDYDIIMDCYTDLLPAKNCTDPNKATSADISDDGVVNQDDYNLFLRELSVQSGD